MKDKELDTLIEKALENDRKALAKLIGYLIELDRDIQERLESLKKTMGERKGTSQTSHYIA